MKYSTRNYKRITLVTVATTLCVLIFSITILAAPMKQKKSDADNVTLPGAGMNKVVNDYVEAANETDVKILANEISTAAKTVATDERSKSVAADKKSKTNKSVNKTEKTTKAEIETVEPETEVAEPETDYVFEEEIYYEPETFVSEVLTEYEEYTEEPYVQEEAYFDETQYAEEYTEPVYTEETDVFLGEENVEEAVYNEPVEEVYYEETVPQEPEIIVEEVTEAPVVEEAVEAPVEEVVEEETTLAQFLEEQDQRIEEEKASKDSASLGQTIANDACQYVGILPYVWAGSSLTTGADCSGFTMAIYAQYGYYLSHDSNVQSVEGRSVPLSEAQPGDIVVYSGHVGMYIGNGQVVHSPHPGTTVSIDSVYMMPVLDVRRIID